MSNIYPKPIHAQHRSRKDVEGKPLRRSFTELGWRMLAREKDGTRKGWKQINAPAGKEPKELKQKTGPAPDPENKVNATQHAIDLAAEEGINLEEVKGSGDEGRITKADIQKIVNS